MNPLRAAIKLTAFALLTLWVYVALMVGKILARDRLAYRRRMFRFAARNVARIFAMRVTVTGAPPAAPCCLVSNHLGYVDIILFATQIDCVFVSKSEVQRWPIIGRIVSDMDTIFIDREKRHDVVRVNDHIARAWTAGESIMLFPEGTSTAGNGVRPFRPSLLEHAARNGLPVHYACIWYRTPEDTPPASESVCWWGDMTFHRHLWTMLSLPGFEAHVHFGREPVVGRNRKQMAVELHQRVTDQLVSITPLSRPR